VTLAVKGCPAPARTFAAVGVTLTVICEGGVEPGDDFVVPVQLTFTNMSASASPKEAHRICSLQVFRAGSKVRVQRCPRGMKASTHDARPRGRRTTGRKYK
jgi:hypothetical protein